MADWANQMEAETNGIHEQLLERELDWESEEEDSQQQQDQSGCGDQSAALFAAEAKQKRLQDELTQKDLELQERHDDLRRVNNRCDELFQKLEVKESELEGRQKELAQLKIVMEAIEERITRREIQDEIPSCQTAAPIEQKVDAICEGFVVRDNKARQLQAVEDKLNKNPNISKLVITTMDTQEKVEVVSKEFDSKLKELKNFEQILPDFPEYNGMNTCTKLEQICQAFIKLRDGAGKAAKKTAELKKKNNVLKKELDKKDQVYMGMTKHIGDFQRCILKFHDQSKRWASTAAEAQEDVEEALRQRKGGRK